MVFSIATYESNMLGAQNTVVVHKKKLKAFEPWCYRRLLRVSWTERKTNEWVLQKMGMANDKRLLATIIKRKMAFAGHILRGNSIEFDNLTSMIYGKRGRGRSKTKFQDNVKEYI